ncbi:MAG: hypothetical protein JNM55_11445 [Anaerolineales bacterium]|nr:hypothetical protein [Anaerolineales bacterium]
MKVKSFLFVAVIIAMSATACGSTDTTPPSSDKILASVNTAVALTSMSQPIVRAATEIEQPAATLTPIPFPTATLMSPLSSPTTYTSYVAASACESSAYISDVTIPDGTVFSQGETFTKIWRIKNTGTCTWSSTYSIMFSSGEEMSGETTEIGQTVAPNATGDISVELTAPDTDGTYTGYWILANSSGTAFGNYVYVQIVVSSSSSTSTITSTTTSNTATNTTAPTVTNAPTNTTEPTEEPTATP